MENQKEKTTVVARRISTALYFMMLLVCCSGRLLAQTAKKTILVDVAHGQRFYNNPDKMNASAGQDQPRAAYMIGELKKDGAKSGAEVGFIDKSVTSADLAKCDLLFVHIPSSKFAPAEVKAVTEYVSRGGALFLVMDVDYWSTLAQTNVNDLIKPFGIQFGNDSPDSLSGGYTKASAVTPKPLKITYHGGRLVNGGTPFCYNNQTDAYPFGVYQAVNGGGKLIVMGDGMTSLYMTEWNGVTDYQCSEFMNDALKWLLER